VIIDNRPGASTIIASEMTSKAPPDGYTLMLITVTHAINAGIFSKLPYNTLTDFQPLAFVAKSPNVLLVHPSLPVKSVKELTALAKANPGKLNYGSTGNSSPYQIAGEMYKMMTGTDIVHVPYKGAGPALTAFLSGEVTVMFGQVVSAIPHIRSGRMRALAVTTETRAAVLPDLPTMAEAGLKGYAFTSWFGIIGPEGMSPDLVAKINTDVAQALKSPEVTTRLQRDGAELEYMTPEKFGEHIQVEIQRLTKVIKAGNITAE
jgi:tripartite-type tricarboxylate transporter receptor subunit TctC